MQLKDCKQILEPPTRGKHVMNTRKVGQEKINDKNNSECTK